MARMASWMTPRSAQAEEPQASFCLRRSDTVRRLCRETRLSPDALIYPIFVDEALTGVRPIESLPGQNHYGPDSVCEAVEDCLGYHVRPGSRVAQGRAGEDCEGLVVVHVGLLRLRGVRHDQVRLRRRTGGRAPDHVRDCSLCFPGRGQHAHHLLRQGACGRQSGSASRAKNRSASTSSS